MIDNEKLCKEVKIMSEFLCFILEVVVIALIVVLGAFLLSLILDAIFSAFSITEGVYFNKGGKKEKNTKDNDYKDVVVHTNIDNTTNVVQKANTEDQQEYVDIDFNKAVEEQKALQSKEAVETPVAKKEVKQGMTDEEYDKILNDVTKESLEIYNKEQKEMLAKKQAEEEAKRKAEEEARLAEAKKKQEELAIAEQKKKEEEAKQTSKPKKQEVTANDQAIDKQLKELRLAKEMFEQERKELVKLKDEMYKEKYKNPRNHKKNKDNKQYKYYNNNQDINQLKREWRLRETELLELQRKQQQENEKEIKALVDDLNKSKEEIEKKQEQINQLINKENDYTKEMQELEDMKTAWRNKEKEFTKRQDQEIAEYEKLYDELSYALDSYKKEINNKEAEIEELKKQNEDFSKETEDLQELKDNLKDKEQQIFELKENRRHEDQQYIDSLIRELEVSRAEIATKQEEIDALKKENSDVTEYVKELEQLKDELQNKQKELEDRQEQQKEENDKQINKLASELQIFINNMEQKEQEIYQLKDKEKDYSEEISELEEMKKAWDQKERELEMIQARIRQEERQEIEFIEKCIDDINKQMKHIVKENEVAKHNLDIEVKNVSKNDTETVSQNIAKIKETISNNEAEYKKLQQELDRLLITLIAKLNTEIDNLKILIQNKELEIAEFEKLKQNVNAQTAELKSLNKQLKLSEDDLKTYSERYNKSATSRDNDNISAKYQEISKMNARLTKIIQNVASVEKESVQAKKEAEVKTLEDNNNQLKSQNEKLKRITQSLQQLSKNKSTNNSDAPIQYANSNNSATIEYKKKTTKKLTESVILEESTPSTTQNSIDSNNQIIVEPVAETKTDNKTEAIEVQPVVVRKKIVKPIVFRSQYETKLDKLNDELADAEKELKKISKEYLPLLRIKKAYERDKNKLTKKEMQVAKQKISMYGVKNTKVSEEKAEKIKSDMAIIEDLRDSIRSCEVVLEQNKNRLPDLEKNYMLINKNISLIKEQIENIQELIKTEE